MRMNPYYTLKIKKESLEGHVKRICRSNLKKPAKICQVCPFIETILEIMDKYDWQYNRNRFKELGYLK